MAKEEVKSVIFKNDDSEEFVCSWDSVPYRFAAGKEMYVEDWKAEHFAKHWADKLMNRAGMITSNKLERDVFLARCLPTSEAFTEEEVFDLNAREAVKEKKASKKVVQEEEFSELTAKAKK